MNYWRLSSFFSRAKKAFIPGSRSSVASLPCLGSNSGGTITFAAMSFFLNASFFSRYSSISSWYISQTLHELRLVESHFIRADIVAASYIPMSTSAHAAIVGRFGLFRYEYALTIYFHKGSSLAGGVLRYTLGRFLAKRYDHSLALFLLFREHHLF